jgi:hypothetical protein
MCQLLHSNRRLRQLHCTVNLFYEFPEMKLHRFIPNSNIHVSVKDLYFPRIGLPIRLQKNRQSDPGNIQIAHRYMNVEISDRIL